MNWFCVLKEVRKNGFYRIAVSSQDGCPPSSDGLWSGISLRQGESVVQVCQGRDNLHREENTAGYCAV